MVAVTDDYLRGGLAELNAAALVSGRPWLLVRPGGRQCWLGPLMRPGQSACWECLAQRLRANRDVERFVGRRRGTVEPFPPPLGVVPAVTADAVVALVVLEVLKVVGGATVTVDGRVVTIEWPTLERAEHVVVRRPQCPACGDPSPAEPQPVEVESQPKGWFVDGGHRTRSPHDTWTSYQHHVSPITGAVSGVDEISRMRGCTSTALDRTWPGRPTPSDGCAGDCAAAARARGAHTTRLAAARCVRPSSATRDASTERRPAAEAATGSSASGRSIRTHACSGATLSTTTRSTGTRATPRRTTAFPPASTRTHSSTGRPSGRSPTTPSSTSPAGTATTPSASKASEPFYYADSNGTAAGTNRTEAILQGFLELVERDAVAMWWYHRLQRPAVDLDSIGDPYVADLRAQYAELHRDVGGARRHERPRHPDLCRCVMAHRRHGRAAWRSGSAPTSTRGSGRCGR